MRAAVLGTGIMGAGMAQSLAREGHDVVVWNRTRDKADGLDLAVADSVAAAVEGADVVVTMLFDADSVLAVADELVGALGDEAVWLQCTTVGPEGARRIGGHSDRVLDAPVLGTRKPAEEGALVFLTAGRPAWSRPPAPPWRPWGRGSSRPVRRSAPRAPSSSPATPGSPS